MKKIMFFALFLMLLIPLNISAYSGVKYNNYSGLSPLTDITASEIDHSKSIFVSPDGSDDNNGSIDSPYKTITKAISESYDNCTIYLREGTYSEYVNINKSNLTLRNYPGETAKIVASNDNSIITNINIESGLSNITIYGLNIQDREEFEDYSAYGIVLRGSITNLIIQNNTFTNINGNESLKWNGIGYSAHAFAIYGNTDTPASNILITGNNVHDMDCGRSEAIVLSGYVENVDIIENNIKDIFNIGIDIAGLYDANPDPTKDYTRHVYIAGNKIENAVSDIKHNAGIYIDGGQDVLIERNFVTGCPYGIEVGVEQNETGSDYNPKNIIVSSNLLVNNLQTELRIGASATSNNPVVNSYVINNTLIHPETAEDSAIILGEGHDNYIINNVVVDNGTHNRLINTDDGSTSSQLYNLYIQNNYMYHKYFAGKTTQYFKIADTRYSEAEFQTLDFVTDNVIGQEIELDDNYVVKVGTILETCGLKNDLVLSLRDYNGTLRDEPVNLGYITINSKNETDETNEEVEPNNNTTETNTVKEVKNDNQKVVDNKEEIKNPQTIDNIYVYLLLLVFGMFGTLMAVGFRNEE